MMANEQSEVQRDVKLRGSAERIPPKMIPGDENIPFDDLKNNDRIPQQEVPDHVKIMCDKQEGDDRIWPQKSQPIANPCLKQKRVITNFVTKASRRLQNPVFERRRR